MKIKSLKLIGISIALSAVLTACGGGGGSSATTSTPATSGACATASNCALPSSVSGIPPQN